MTEKKYEAKCLDINAWYVERNDSETIVYDLFKVDAEAVTNELNRLADENEQLKQQLEKETDKVIELEQFIYTQLASPSENYNEEVLSLIMNEIVGDL